MLNEMTLTVVTGVLLLLGLASVVRFSIVTKEYTRPFKRMKRLAQENGISWVQQSKGLEMMREMHRQISTAESAQLLSQAELAAPKFVSGLRLVLVFFIPAVVCLALMKYFSAQ